MAPHPRRKAVSPPQRGWANVRSMQKTQRLYIYNELSRARDLCAVSNLIPTLMPGGILMLLPLFAWQLGRRHKRRRADH